MIAQWMLASLAVSALVAGAAFLLARVTSLYRGRPLRWIWAGAMLASLGVSGYWLVRKPAPVRIVPASSARGVAIGALASPSVAHTSPSVASAPSPAVRLPELSGKVDTPLAIAWGLGSAILLVLIAGTAMKLASDKRSWRRQAVANTPVLIAPEFGPAIVGFRRPDIVLPEWVLALDDASQRMIVTHELEHRAAADPAMLHAALVALVVMPWNFGLWLSWRGLRRAIELDCDARVVARGVDDSAYASVLLGAWRSARGSWIPSAAFAERVSGLGARVEHLMRPEPRRRAMKTIIGAGISTALVAMACMTPAPRKASSLADGPYPLVIIDGVKRPDLPPRERYVGAVMVETTTTPTYAIRYRGATLPDSAARKLYPSADSIAMMQTIDAPASVAHFGEAARYGAVLYYTNAYRKAGGLLLADGQGSMMARAAAPGTPSSEMAQRVYDRLFVGISLPQDRASQALSIITTTFEQQKALKGPMLVRWPELIDLQSRRDAALRGLLTTAAEREQFDPRAREGRPQPITTELMAQSLYNNLFRNPATPPETKARALAVITTSLNDEIEVYRRNPPGYEGRLALRAKRDTLLRALQPTDADRAAFDKIAPRTRDNEIKP